MFYRWFPDFFFDLFTQLSRPAFRSFSPASQPCLATIFKPKRKLFAIGQNVIFQSEIPTN
jgi:hypothetical protein